MRLSWFTILDQTLGIVNGEGARLNNVIQYVWVEAQGFQTRDEHEDFSITLRLLECVREGWTGNLFNMACCYAVGLQPAKYLKRKAERAAFERDELAACIPDYDGSIGRPPYGSAKPFEGKRDSPTQRKHYCRRLVMERITIERGRLRGRLCETLECGHLFMPVDRLRLSSFRRCNECLNLETLHGNQLCNLAPAPIEGDDTNPTRGANEHYAATDIRFRNRAGADHKHSSARSERPAGLSQLSLTYRRSPPKRISSPAKNGTSPGSPKPRLIAALRGRGGPSPRGSKPVANSELGIVTACFR